MYKDCKTPQSAGRQRHIVRCLVEMMQAQTFGEITVQALCRRAQVPRKAFYRYFDNKQDVFLALADEILLEYEQFSGPYRPGERRTPEKDAEKLFLFTYEHKELWAALRRSGLGPALIDRVIQQSGVERARTRLARPGDEPDLVHLSTLFTIYGLFALVRDWQAGGYQRPAKELAAIAARLLSQPLYRPL